MRAEQTATRTEQEAMKETLTRVALTQEITVIPQLQLIYENQIQIIDEHKAIQKIETRIEVLQDEVFTIKEAVKELKRA